MLNGFRVFIARLLILHTDRKVSKCFFFFFKESIMCFKKNVSETLGHFSEGKKKQSFSHQERFSARFWLGIPQLIFLPVFLAPDGTVQFSFAVLFWNFLWENLFQSRLTSDTSVSCMKPLWMSCEALTHRSCVLKDWEAQWQARQQV